MTSHHPLDAIRSTNMPTGVQVPIRWPHGAVTTARLDEATGHFVIGAIPHQERPIEPTQWNAGVPPEPDTTPQARPLVAAREAVAHWEAVAEEREAQAAHHQGLMTKASAEAADAIRNADTWRQALQRLEEMH